MYNKYSVFIRLNRITQRNIKYNEYILALIFRNIIEILNEINLYNKYKLHINVIKIDNPNII